jgi:hypothetical protein
VLPAIFKLLAMTGAAAKVNEALNDFPLDPFTFTLSVIGLFPVTVTPESTDKVASEARPFKVTVMVPLLL